MLVKVAGREKEITTDDPKRWKKFYRSSKQRAYIMLAGTDAFRAGYDKIKWGKHGSCVVPPDIGGETE